jgi:c-di-GMP-binding flagellar brake protein YcgR
VRVDPACADKFIKAKQEGDSMIDGLPVGDGRNEPADTLLSLNLGIGDALQLQDPSASNQRYYVKLIGFLNKAGIIVSHPHRDGAWLPAEEGKSLLVRGFSGRKTYEFSAYVLSSNTFPYPHLHLTVPKKIETMTMLAALRIKPRSLAGWVEQAEADSGAIKLPMIIVDISTSGARVHARRKLGGIGDQVKVMIRLPIDDEEQIFSISAVIRKSYTDMLPEVTNGGEVTTYGLEFIQPEGDVRMALQGYIYKMMAEG